MAKINLKEKLKNPWFIVSMVLIAILLIFVQRTINIIGTTQNINADSIDSQESLGNSYIDNSVVSVSADDDAILGDKNAPIEIIEFSDYECPFCTRFYTDTLPQLKTTYIDTGKAKLIYRDFPLGFHANAQKAAEAGECAGDEGKYFEMHDKLFEQGVSGGVTAFKQYAKEIGLNTATFDVCLDSGKYTSEVQKDFQDGQRAGVQGTPTFYINGQQLVGAQPFEAFQQIIEQELNK
jgi:protein-disulfide isomerase